MSIYLPCFAFSWDNSSFSRHSLNFTTNWPICLEKIYPDKISHKEFVWNWKKCCLEVSKLSWKRLHMFIIQISSFVWIFLCCKLFSLKFAAVHRPAISLVKTSIIFLHYIEWIQWYKFGITYQNCLLSAGVTFESALNILHVHKEASCHILAPKD